MIPIRGAPRGRTLQGHLAPWEHHGGDAGGQTSAPPLLAGPGPPSCCCAEGPLPSTHSCVPHFQPKPQLLGHQAPPPPEPAGGQGPGPPVPERVPTPRYRDAPRSPGSACSEVCRQRGGKKTWGGGTRTALGAPAPTPCLLPCTFMPHSRGKQSDPTEILEPGGTDSHVPLQNTARSPAEHPLGGEGGCWSPRPARGPGGGHSPAPGTPIATRERKSREKRGVWLCRSRYY